MTHVAIVGAVTGAWPFGNEGLAASGADLGRIGQVGVAALAGAILDWPTRSPVADERLAAMGTSERVAILANLVSSPVGTEGLAALATGSSAVGIREHAGQDKIGMRSPEIRLGLAMATRAQSDQVVEPVSLDMIGAETKRHDVMDGQVTPSLAAMLASVVIPRPSKTALFGPRFALVLQMAAAPSRVIGSLAPYRVPSIETRAAAKVMGANSVRFSLKRLSAGIAGDRGCFHGPIIRDVWRIAKWM